MLSILILISVKADFDDLYLFFGVVLLV